jgi:hypothetical protein
VTRVRVQVDTIREHIRAFKRDNGVDKVVVLWTANTERYAQVRAARRPHSSNQGHQCSTHMQAYPLWPGHDAEAGLSAIWRLPGAAVFKVVTGVSHTLLLLHVCLCVLSVCTCRWLRA